MKLRKKQKKYNSEEINEILKQIRQEKDKKTKEKKQKRKKSIDDIVKTKKTSKKTIIQYNAGFGTQANISYNNFAGYDTIKIDYENLYSYLGSGVKQLGKQNYEIKNTSSDNLGEKEILSSEQVDTILRKTVMSQVIKSSLDNISIEEKEKFNYYKQFNRLWVMIKYDLLGIGNYA